MAMNFPNSPATNDTFTVGSNTWMYDGEKWLLVRESLALDDLVDVSASTPTAGEFLKYDGSNWVPDPIPTINSLNDIEDVVVSSAVNGQVLKFNGIEWINDSEVIVSDTAPIGVPSGTLWYDSTNLDLFIYYGSAWVELIPEVGAEELTDLSDISISLPTPGQVLKYNGTEWVNEEIVNSLDDIPGVTITTPTSGQFLKWNGSAWVNDAIDLGTDTTGNYVADVVAGTAITVTHTPGEGSSATIALNASLNDFNDAVITSPEEFQTLEYNGTNWVNTYASVVSYVRNAEATTLTTGTVVYLFGSTSDHATVKRADNNSDATSSKTVGVVGVNIAASENGPVVTRGYVDGINLSTGYTAGDVLWLGENGAFTKTKPSAPDHLVFIGVVVRATNNGIIYVATQNGYELDELHDVSIISKTSGDFLKYNGSLWVNDQINLGTDTVGNYVQNLVAGTGVTLSNNSGEGATPTVAIGQAVDTSSSVQFASVSTNTLTVEGIEIDTSGVANGYVLTYSQVENKFKPLQSTGGGGGSSGGAQLATAWWLGG